MQRLNGAKTFVILPVNLYCPAPSPGTWETIFLASLVNVSFTLVESQHTSKNSHHVLKGASRDFSAFETGKLSRYCR